MDKSALVSELLELFRQHGYEGVSIGDVSKATGLGKSSLYHHFPGGKEEMALEVLGHIDMAVKQYFIAPLKEEGAPEAKLKAMAKTIEEFYEGGRKGCIVDGLTLGAASAPFQELIRNCLEAWIEAMAAVAKEHGVSEKLARERAENALIAIEGALVVSRALQNYQIFKRVTRNLPRLILD